MHVLCERFLGCYMKPAQSLTKAMAQFAKGENGNATYFACFIIMMMVMIGGLGVDLMHSEFARTKLQNTLDRAVLAAADLDETRSPNRTARDYVEKSGILEDPFISATLEYTFGRFDNDTKVDRYSYLRASANITTRFMHRLGVDTLRIPVDSSATETRQNIEISLVLDISASMGENNRLENMQAAAIEFARTVLTPDTEDLVSLSIIPYTGHVNPGFDIARKLPMSSKRVSPYYDCPEFEDRHFSSPALDLEHIYTMAQHIYHMVDYDDMGNLKNNRSATLCSPGFAEIRPLSQDLAAIEAQINELRPGAHTSIFLGVKWGAALLDSSMRGIVQALSNEGHIDPVFAERPADYSDDSTLKMIVVMSDGENMPTVRIKDQFYATASHARHWARYNLWYWLETYVHPVFQQDTFFEVKYTSEKGDDLLAQICTASKDQGIVIWGVGYEITDHGADVLESCASSPSHFFRVEGREISDAFGAIANKITQLRLTQ
jgi:Flp pilus assembly protein TadG